MDPTHKTKLTGPEITSLWTQYQGDSLSLRVNTYMYEHLEDEQIKSIFKEAIQTSEHNLTGIEKLLKQENYPVPLGFTENDVFLNAPKLYSDGLCLKYLHEMTIHGLSAYTLAFTVSTRQDIRKFYEDKINDSMKLYNQTIEILLSKGIYHRPPYVPNPDGIDYIKTENFFSGFFGDKRTLNGNEISNVYFNLEKSVLTKAILIGFSQVVNSKEARNTLIQGIEIKKHHIDGFSKILTDDNLPAPSIWDSDVADSTVPPFSEKLMMYLAGFLFNAAISYYGAALGTTMRSDLIVQYQRFILEDLKYAEDWADFMIKNKWLEQPPKASDRKKLAEDKNK